MRGEVGEMADGPAARCQCLEQCRSREPKRPVHVAASTAVDDNHAGLQPVGRVMKSRSPTRAASARSRQGSASRRNHRREDCVEPTVAREVRRFEVADRELDLLVADQLGGASCARDIRAVAVEADDAHRRLARGELEAQIPRARFEHQECRRRANQSRNIGTRWSESARPPPETATRSAAVMRLQASR